MKRIIIYLTIAFLSVFCFAKAQAQGVTMFGISNPSRTSDTSKTWGRLVVPYLATSDSNKVVGVTSTGHFVLRNDDGGADSTIFATQYQVDTANANLRTSIATKVNYSDSAGFLPTKTFLANNYFANGGNNFGATAVLGTNGSNALDFETNNTVRGRIGATGNWMIGTTTDAGYKLDVNGTTRLQGHTDIYAPNSSGTQMGLLISHPTYALGNDVTMVLRPRNTNVADIRFRAKNEGGSANALCIDIYTSTALRNIARFDNTKLEGINIGADTVSLALSGTKLLLGGQASIVSASDADIRAAAISLGRNANIIARYHTIYYKVSSTADSNYVQIAPHSGSGAAGQVDGLMIRGNNRLGIGVFTPQESIHTSGNIQVNTVKIITGSGAPEGAVTAPQGSIYMRTGGGAGSSFYVKESGSGNTGWVGK